jgi:ADP-ribose pyrophosphatase YjhB (NUDIX family)
MTDDVPIRLIQRELGCANRLIEVFLDDIEEPGRAPISDFVVLAPRQKTQNLVTGVAVLPVLDGNFGLLKIYRHPIRDYTWEAPRGFVEAGEKALTSALRELQEETGLLCESQHVTNLGTVLPEPGIIAGRTHLFAATQCRLTGPFRANEIGHKELRFFSEDELNDMARQGIIEDASTLAACYRYFLARP